MVAVHFFENKTLLLSQLRQNVPATGEELKIKGKKAKVLLVTDIDNTNVHIQVAVEKIVKKNPVDDAKKKRR